MILIPNLVRTGVLVSAMLCLSPIHALAQEFSESHLAAAHTAATGTPLSGNFDTVLPRLVGSVQNRLISVRPDLHQEISATVQEVALRLVARRNDLDNAVALVWARAFTEEELTAIADFFASDVGKKFTALGPGIRTSTRQTVDNWSSRVGEELMDKTREDLKKDGHEF